MAGLGTVFVEIQIDRSKFSRSLQQLEREAISSSLQIEDNFKRLGIKSSYEFDLMRQKAVNAYEAIKHSAQATANDILRAEQAKSQQFARINEEQFGKQQAWFERLKELTAGILPGISGLTLGIGGLTTALTGAGYAASRLLDGFKEDALAIRDLRFVAGGTTEEISGLA